MYFNILSCPAMYCQIHASKEALTDVLSTRLRPVSV
jgi:hypothetical protein